RCSPRGGRRGDQPLRDKGTCRGRRVSASRRCPACGRSCAPASNVARTARWPWGCSSACSPTSLGRGHGAVPPARRDCRRVCYEPAESWRAAGGGEVHVAPEGGGAARNWRSCSLISSRLALTWRSVARREARTRNIVARAARPSTPTDPAARRLIIWLATRLL